MQSMIWENEDITEEEAEALERQSTLLKIKLVEATTRIKEWGMQTGMERCIHMLSLSLRPSVPPSFSLFSPSRVPLPPLPLSHKDRIQLCASDPAFNSANSHSNSHNLVCDATDARRHLSLSFALSLSFSLSLSL
jgi:hypothetical protein